MIIFSFLIITIICFKLMYAYVYETMGLIFYGYKIDPQKTNVFMLHTIATFTSLGTAILVSSTFLTVSKQVWNNLNTVLGVGILLVIGIGYVLCLVSLYWFEITTLLGTNNDRAMRNKLLVLKAYSAALARLEKDRKEPYIEEVTYIVPEKDNIQVSWGNENVTLPPPKTKSIVKKEIRYK